MRRLLICSLVIATVATAHAQPQTDPGAVNLTLDHDPSTTNVSHDNVVPIATDHW